jgi:hypothetical protein
MKYKVTIRMVECMVMEVEANSPEEAENNAMSWGVEVDSWIEAEEVQEVKPAT